MWTTVELLEVIAVLRRARRLIEKGWCQRAAARNSRGSRTLPQSDEACQWCASGAFNRAVDTLYPGLAYERRQRLGEAVWSRLQLEILLAQPRQHSHLTVSEWNDVEGRTKQEVLELFDRAIESVRS